MMPIESLKNSLRKEEAMIDDILTAIVVLANIASFSYYLYLIGKVKGWVKAVNVLLEMEKEKKAQP